MSQPEQWVDMPVPSNTATLADHGPVYLRGDLVLHWRRPHRSASRRPESALCRCGGSANKPFCDGTHGKIGFAGRRDVAGARKAGSRQSPTAASRFAPGRTGPLMVTGPLVVVGTNGRMAFKHDDVPLPVRRIAEQAVLRRHAHEDRIVRLAPPGGARSP